MAFFKPKLSIYMISNMFSSIRQKSNYLEMCKSIIVGREECNNTSNITTITTGNVWNDSDF